MLVTEELARAVRTESAAAVCHWWGVTPGVVWRWRKALGVTHWGTEGSKRLHQEVSERGSDAIRGRRPSAESIRKRVQTRRQQGYPPPDRWAEDGWKPEEVALLGALADEEVARRLGCSISAVSQKRRRQGILNRPRPTGWTAAEDEAVRTLTPAEAAAATGRTLPAVYARRFVLARAGKQAAEGTNLVGMPTP